MLDDLRKAARDQDDDEFTPPEVMMAARPDEGKLFGMTAVERMFLSIGIFGITVVISVLLLVLTESIYLGF